MNAHGRAYGLPVGLAMIAVVMGCSGSASPAPAATAPHPPSLSAAVPAPDATTAPTQAPSAEAIAGPGSWVKVGGMSTAITNPRAALAGGGRVLLLDADSYCYFPGDQSADGFWTRYAAVFEPTSGKVSGTASIDAPRFGFAMTALSDGRVLVAGGYNERTIPKSSTRIWSPATGKWIEGPLMSIARAEPVAVGMRDGRVLIAGGWTPSGKDTPTGEIFDPATDHWSRTGSVPWANGPAMAVTLTSGHVLGLGPDADGAIVRAALYDPDAGTWADVDRPPQNLNGASPVALGDGTALLFPGGSRSVIRYDRAAGWSSAGTLTTSRSGATATLLDDGRVLVAGGRGDSRDDGTYEVLKTAELFDPHTGRSSKAASMPQARWHGIAIRLEDGSVLLAGGEKDVPVDTPSCPTLVESAVRWIP